MPGRLLEENKIDVALKPTSLATTNATGSYFNLVGYGKALFACSAAAIAATKTVVWQVMEAKSGIAGGAQALTALTATITANTAVKSATVAASTVIATDALVINDGTKSQSYLCKTSGAVAASGEFNVGVSDTLTMDNLVTAIHTCQPGLYAVNTTGTVLVVARDPGNRKITITTDDTTLTIATVDALALIEVDAGQLTSTYTHVAIRATTDATIVCSAMLVRAPARISLPQFVAATDVA